MIFRKYVSILCCDLIDVTLPGKGGDTILADNAFIVIIFGDLMILKICYGLCRQLVAIGNVSLYVQGHIFRLDIAISEGSLFECMHPIKKAVEVVIADFTISNPF